MALSDRTPGAAQTRSKQHHVFGGDPFPQTAYKAKGAYVWSIKNSSQIQCYIDWMAALASVGLGYNNDYVEEAVTKQRYYSAALPLPSELEYEVADLLCQALKWPQQVRFVKTGSEATAAAMMIARRATGRKKIISIGYHGWHECHLPSADLVDVPWGYGSGSVDYQTAAILVEPMRDHQDTPNRISAEMYLLRLQQIAKEYGALFIMDEMVTGFRWAIGGASEYFGITPDLATYGKAMANGYALAAVVGSRKLMKHALDVSSTFGGEGVGLAAAKATIEVYQRELVIERLWAVGKKLQKGVPQLQGWPVHPHFTGAGGWTDSDSVIPLTQYAAQQGVLMHPSGMNPMYAHTDEQVARTIEVLQQALAAQQCG